MCPIVAIGASAGGLEALEKFFAHMPPDSGMAFVLVPHLDAHHKSAMAELLRRHTSMPVVEIADGMDAAANRVHVIPPNATLHIAQGKLHIVTPRGAGLTIDAFFRSLARDQEANAVGIILSGGGSDGTLGLQNIKEHGGLTMAQASESSRHDSMPRSAAAAGVDYVLPVEAMPALLLQYKDGLARLVAENGDDGVRHETRKELVRVCSVLRARTGHDFSHYKNSTFVRRVQRRMQVVQLASISAYVDLLRKDANEVDALFRDLLIGVTQFFRDPNVFAALHDKVIGALFDEKGPDDQIRVWIPGCATGEEACSIGILLREEMIRRDASLKVQIFATDIDDQAIAIARQGVYPETIARDILAHRLERFFVRDGSTYRVAKEIREMCIFSVHNLIKDAPFSKLDLISCRNLLIYLDETLQARVLSLFHFALRQRGYLLLGPSENISHQPKLFSRIDNKFRIFKASAVESPRPALDFASAGATSRGSSDIERRPAADARETMIRRAQRVLDSYAPAAVVVDDHNEIVHFSGQTGRYLQPTPGTASLSLFNIVNPSLRPDLRTVVHQAIATGRRVVHENVLLPVASGFESLQLIAEPLPVTDGDRRMCVIIFQDQPAPRESAGTADAVPDSRREQTIRHLESELTATRERLQTTIEELETSNEEMKSSNEEFQSLNEELQSSNEELETSKEELQSVNEELETVNAELSAKIESLDRVISDWRNLLESTQIASVFLDTQLRIRSFTPAMTDIFHLIQSDHGRPITDIVTRIDYEHLPGDVRRVLRTLERVEQEIALADGSAFYIMRILPYRTINDMIDGAIVTFIDITERKRSEEALARLAAIVAGSYDAIIGMTPQGRITSWNAGAERIYGHAAEQAIGSPFSLVMLSDEADNAAPESQPDEAGVPPAAHEAQRVTRDGRRIHVSSTASPIKGAAGRLIGVAVIERDVSDRRQAEEQQRMLLGELNHRVKNTMAAVLSISSRTRQTAGTLESFSQAFEGRIRALASAHDILARNAWAGTDLRQILLAELSPYHGAKDSVVVTGEPVFVGAQPAVVLGMVFHELATNAAKYGALSVSTGNVAVSWKIAGQDEAARLQLEWIERGGPRVETPSRLGFGVKFIERSLAYDMQGSATLGYRPDGLHCVIEVPLAELASRKRIDLPQAANKA